MKKIIVFIFLAFITIKTIAQVNNSIRSAYKAFVYSIYYDSIVQKTGSLLPEKGEINKSSEPKIIHVKISSRENPEVIKNMKRNFNEKVAYSKIDTILGLVNAELVNEHIIDSSESVYEKKNTHVLGTIIISGVYIPAINSVKAGNIIYFEVIRIGWASKRSQLGELVKVIKKKDKWMVDKVVYTFRS